jgi:hypothetical protein
MVTAMDIGEGMNPSRIEIMVAMRRMVVMRLPLLVRRGCLIMWW